MKAEKPGKPGKTAENTAASSTREKAVLVLHAVFDRARKPKEALDETGEGLDRRERSFLMELVYGVLRNRDYLDWLLAPFLRKPTGLSPVTRNNLRLAVYQLHSMRVPEWAVVNEAVEIEKNRTGREALVNGVLRSFLRAREAMAEPPQDDPVDYISLITSHPRWLVKRWAARFGADEALGLARKNNEVPPLTIRVDGEGARERALQLLAEKRIAAHPTRFSPAGITLNELHSVSELSEAVDFPFVVQDEAAQLVGYLLNPSPGERVLDAAAAPGGKTTHLARLMGDRGEVVAVEAEAKRLPQLEENITRLGIRSVRILHRDANELTGAELGCFDRILLDAPCSSLGVIRRNPDVKYRHQRGDLGRFKERQLELLLSVSRLLRAGGTMVYAVCSTEPEEGEEVIGAFLQKSPDFSIIKGDYEFLRPFEVMDSGRVFYRTFPHRHEMDGFFAARLRRA
ncbi:MAG: 16S rRNA (cytosine(967)-C(5))-methyltransferase RsmB [Nitrospirota bacterium]